MRLEQFVGIAACGACLLALAGPVSAKSVILTAQRAPGHISAGVSGVEPAGAGWQGSSVFDVPTGTTDLFFHYPCPVSGAKTPVSGGFLANATAKPGLVLEGNFRRDDVPNEWAWVIDWPGGAPSGSQITFNVYCKRR